MEAGEDGWVGVHFVACWERTHTEATLSQVHTVVGYPYEIEIPTFSILCAGGGGGDQLWCQPPLWDGMPLWHFFIRSRHGASGMHAVKRRVCCDALASDALREMPRVDLRVWQLCSLLQQPHQRLRSPCLGPGMSRCPPSPVHLHRGPVGPVAHTHTVIRSLVNRCCRTTPRPSLGLPLVRPQALWTQLEVAPGGRGRVSRMAPLQRVAMTTTVVDGRLPLAGTGCWYKRLRCAIACLTLSRLRCLACELLTASTWCSRRSSHPCWVYSHELSVLFPSCFHLVSILSPSCLRLLSILSPSCQRWLFHHPGTTEARACGRGRHPWACW